MWIRRKSMRAIISLCTVVFAVAVLGFVRYWTTVSRPLGERPWIKLPVSEYPDSAWRQFLGSDFKIITDVRALPVPVLRAYTEKGGSRLLMANPGQKFEASDAILDVNMPRKLLISAGVADGKCLVYYLQGGMTLEYVVEFFGITSEDTKSPSSIYCHTRASNYQDLRSQLIHDGCSQLLMSR
jgi:hypothetical protein